MLQLVEDASITRLRKDKDLDLFMGICLIDPTFAASISPLPQKKTQPTTQSC